MEGGHSLKTFTVLDNLEVEVCRSHVCSCKCPNIYESITNTLVLYLKLQVNDINLYRSFDTFFNNSMNDLKIKPHL